MTRATHRSLPLAAFLLFPVVGVGADAPVDPDVADVKEKLKSIAADLIVKLGAQDIKAGPFTITAGPQEDGGFGAILTGSGSSDISWLNSAPPSAAQFASGKWMVLRYGTLEFSADANWSSLAGALNQTSVSVKPQVSFSFLSGSKW